MALGIIAMIVIEEFIVDPRGFRHPAVLIDVDRRDDNVAFSFFMTTDPLRFWGDPRRPHGVWQVRVLDGTSPPVKEDDVLWSVVLREGAKPLTQVSYGVVPQGFVQEIPVRGVAPPLVPSRRYVVNAAGYGPLAYGLALFEMGTADGRPYVRRLNPKTTSRHPGRPTAEASMQWYGECTGRNS